MKRREFLKSMAAAPAAVTLRAQGVRPPNFIVILTDDHGYGDLGCYGSPYIRTPNIDRMAAEGVRFTDFYAQPFCGPSRAALLTGCYPVRNSLMFNHLPKAKTGIHPNEMTLAELLKQRGYATMIVGKWHLGDAPEFLPMRHGFDSWYGLPYSNDMWPFHPKMEPSPDESPRQKAVRERAKMTGYSGEGQVYPKGWFPDLPLMQNDEVVELNPDQTKLTGAYTEKALEFISQNKERPFLLYLAHSMPHVPLYASKEFQGKSKRGLYGDVIEEIDAGVGRILGRLKQLGLDEHTLVVFTSDNGPWLDYGIDAGSAGPLRGGKGTLWEGGVRVPAVMRYPGRIPAGLVTSELVANMDLFATFAHLAGAKPPADRIIDSRDIWPLLSRKDARSSRDAFYYYEGGLHYDPKEGRPQNKPVLKAVRSGQWKLHIDSGELYDLLGDVGETKNVAARHPDEVRRLGRLAKSFHEDLLKNVRPLGQR